MNKTYITGSGVWTPPNVITNEELVASFNEYVRRFNKKNGAAIDAGEIVALQPSSVEFIEKGSGIKQRYVIDKAGVLDPDRMYPNIPARPNGEISIMAEIAVNAAKLALEAAGRTAAEVDLVIVACANFQRPYPALAIEVQHALGCGGYGYDMNVACSAGTFGIEQAANAIRSGQARCALVLGPEITSGHLEWRDRDCHFIFGDVATAVVIEAEPSGKQTHLWEILGSRAATSFSNNIRNNSGFLDRCEADGRADKRDKLFMQEGRKVFKEVCPMAAEHISTHLAEHGLAPKDVRRFWLHQANLSMNQFITRRLLDRDPTPDEAPIVLDKYANTASAGSIIAFHQNQADLPSGSTGIICSFGAGYSIGSHVLRRI
ncbi:MAG: beta-ketoacyl-ACP synthase III [Rhodocyclaceae bacterium]|nr:beta-ketoacyl-ACP synthase III [Rhodocyclaceae bacterium]MBK9623719.1 beta-ketoacyl-ACP synthase III [Rhodocyclaceae bacterium]MBL0075320.1 beta-ketoacyl-ACP synthase III [Rhodocyclaceae bacterium]MBP6108447.1 beta-ketoacyl-ACP synthase III [Rhodocyclaceae bacterium]MBP6278268.1 beta-ketoacyl-ACP synthase III [Rhodocyclaceae bacterium]